MYVYANVLHGRDDFQTCRTGRVRAALVVSTVSSWAKVLVHCITAPWVGISESQSCFQAKRELSAPWDGVRRTCADRALQVFMLTLHQARLVGVPRCPRWAICWVWRICWEHSPKNMEFAYEHWDLTRIY